MKGRLIIEVFIILPWLDMILGPPSLFGKRCKIRVAEECQSFYLLILTQEIG
jgi:hypothetical protein